MDPVHLARSSVLGTVRWTNGHADFAAVFRDAATLGRLGPALAAPFEDEGVTAVIGIEARGFVVAALCAQHMRVGLVLVRKPGSVHPGPKVEVVSAPDWRGREVALRLPRVLSPADRVLLVDDWIETGSQAKAVRDAVQACGATFLGTSVIVDDTNDRALMDLNVASIIQSSEIDLA